MPPSTLPPPRSFQQRLEACGPAFSRRGKIAAQALEGMAAEAVELTGSAAAAIWLYDRRARALWLAARSGVSAAAGPSRVAADDPEALPALGLTIDRPRQLPLPHAATIVAPLRGWRRALGTLVLEGARPSELSQAEHLELAHQVGRRLSAAIENIQVMEEVVRQHGLLQASFDSLVDLVIVSDADGAVIQMNDAARRVLGVSGDPFGTPLMELTGDDLARWAAGDADPDEPTTPATPSRARTRTFSGTPLGGTAVVTVTALASGDGAPAGRVIVGRDITEPKRLEAEREALQARLAQSEKLAAVGQFVAGVAHEINNPLQGVLGYVELLLRSSTDAGQKADLRRVLHEADRAAKIVRNLLVFSGVRRTVQRRLTVEGLISRVLTTRRVNLADRGIEVVRRHPDRRARVLGDDLMLQQAILNILVNAEHAIAEAGAGGTIHISTEPAADGRTVVTRIRDTGPGIDGAVLSRIFDPFFTTKEVDKGTGLGLSIAYGIVKDHGGTLHAENAPDGGAQFTIQLPVADVAAEPSTGDRTVAEDA